MEDPAQSKSNIGRSILWMIVIAVVLVGGYPLTKQKGAVEMKVGIIAPSTGNFAVFGERMRRGFEMAKEDLLKGGAIDSLELIYEDACQPKDAVSAVQKLITVNHIQVLGGSFCVVGFVPSIPILEENKILTFNTAPNPDDALNKKYVVSTNSSIQEKASQLATFARETLNAKTVAVIYYNTPLGKDYEKYFSLTFTQKGGEVVSSELTLVDATDFRTPLTKIKAKNVDVIFVVQLASPLGNLLKQARELGIKASILGNSQNEDPTIIDTAGKAAEGFLISSDEPFPKTNTITDFEKRFFAKYNQKPDVYATNSYDALTIQVEAFKKCKGDTECMLVEARAIKNYPGVSGVITIKPDGSASKSTTFKVVRNGAFVPFER